MVTFQGDVLHIYIYIDDTSRKAETVERSSGHQPKAQDL